MTSLRQERVKWEVAGLADDRRGILGMSRLPTSEILLPERIWLEGDLLHYTPPPFSGTTWMPSTTDGMLDAFVRIENSDHVLRFASTYGPLHLCSHGAPSSHAYEHDEGFRDLLIPDRSSCAAPVPERTEDWLRWVACARGLLTGAAALHEERLPTLEDWTRITAGLSPASDSGEALHEHATNGSLEDARLLLGDFLWFWLRMADVRPKFAWDPEPKLFMDSGTFGELGIQLMQAISHAHGLAMCSGCGNPYMRKGRKPQAGRRNYCPDCGITAALRDAQRERRAKKREDDGKAR